MVVVGGDSDDGNVVVVVAGVSIVDVWRGQGEDGPC